MRRLGKIDPKLISSLFVLGFLVVSIAVIVRYIPEQRGVQPRAAASTVTLIAAGSGVYSDNEAVPVGCSQKWQCVDDPSSDEDGSYVRARWGEFSPGNFGFGLESYDLPSSGIPEGSTINSFSVYIRVKGVATSHTPLACPILWARWSTGGGMIKGSCDPVPTGSYTTLGLTNVTCNSVATGCPAWTLQSANSLQVGWYADSNTRLTRAWAVISYTPPPPPADTTPPTRSNGSPTGTLSAGTTQATLSLNTNEAATCKYATGSGVSYNSMPYTFSTTGGTSHSKVVTGLSNGNSYSYYVRCKDSAGNANTNDYKISFSVAPPDDDGDNGDDGVLPPPDDDGGGDTTPPSPGDGLPSLPPPPPAIPGVEPTIDPNIVNYLKVEVSVPYLLGKITVSTQIGGYSHELEVSPGKNEYSIDLRGAKFSLGKLLSIATGGSKTLTKKLKIKSKAPKQPAKLGRLDLGDITGDNRINGEDMAYYLKSLSNQTKEGEINADGEVNSLDWAILLVNFGKIGDR